MAVGLLRRPVGLLLRVVDVQTSGDAPLDVATEAELRLLARQAAAGGAIEPSDAHLVERSFRFGDLRVRDIMVPRDRIRFVRAEETVEVGLARALAFGHRRLPVVRTTLDDVIGVVRLRDLAAAAGDTKTDTLATALLRCAPSDSIDDVLANMQHHRCKVAIVANGAGRTVGLLTIEDIVGELVGDIADDH